MSFFPTTIATDAQLYVAVNNTQTTLASPALITDTVLTLTSTTGFPATGAITFLDNGEVAFYTGISGNTLTGVIRGADGTPAFSHLAGVLIGLTIVAAHHNLLKNEIEAIETALGANYTRTVENLSDVDVSSVLVGQYLMWNGTEWVNNTSPGNGITALTGDVSAAGSGSVSSMVNSVGGKTSSQISTAVTEADASISSLTGDVTASGPGAAATVLATVNSDVGSFTNASVTVNAKGLVTAVSSGTIPVQIPSGSMVVWLTNTAPTDWLLMDGTTYAEAVSPTLYTILGGSGGFFTVPNLTNYVLMGAGDIASLMTKVGSATHTLTNAEVPSGSYSALSTVTDPGHLHQINAGNQVTNGGSGQNTMGRATGTDFPTDTATTGITVSTTVSDANGGGAHSIIQPSYGVYFIIKT